MPLKKGTPASRIIAPGVKVFRIGKNNNGDENVITKPTLILVRPAVNVLGKSTIRLANPEGWYCFKANVTVAGKLTINTHCSAKIAIAREGGASVVAAYESKGGVAVISALRVTRFDCGARGNAAEKAAEWADRAL